MKKLKIKLVNWLLKDTNYGTLTFNGTGAIVRVYSTGPILINDIQMNPDFEIIIRRKK